MVKIVHVNVVDLQSPSVESDSDVHFGVELVECPVGGSYVPPHIGKESAVSDGGVCLYAWSSDIESSPDVVADECGRCIPLPSDVFWVVIHPLFGVLCRLCVDVVVSKRCEDDKGSDDVSFLYGFHW